MTTTPSWLYYLFAVLTLVVAAYCLILLVVALATRWKPGWDVDVSHVFMGISMAGMFVSKWAFGPAAVWELIFSALLVWFVVRSFQSIQAYGPHLPHTVVHAVMSFAMLLMYWFPMQVSTSSSSSSMSMGAGAAGSALDPGVAFVLAFVFFASAILTLASREKGRSHHGTHAPVYAMSAAGAGPEMATRLPAAPVASLRGVEGILTTPTLEDVSHVVMCVAMGFLLILMT